MKAPKVAIALVFLSIMLVGCVAQPDRLWLNSPDWSRAQLIGNTRINDPVHVATDDNHSTYLFFIQSRDDRPFPRVIAYTDNGKLIWDRSYDEHDLQLPAEPQITWDGGKLLLFWVDDYHLYGASMDTDGEWIDTPAVISGSELVGSVASAVDGDGSLSVWFSKPFEQPGLFSIRDPLETPLLELVDSQGTDPELIYDDQGTLHAIWARRLNEGGINDFIYGIYPSGMYEPGLSRDLISPAAYGTNILEGPHLGVDAEYTYVFWSITFYSGPEAGTVRAQYIFLPRGEYGPVSTARNLSVPWSYDLDSEEPAEAALEAGRRVILEPGFKGGGSYLIQINPNHRYADELVFSFQARLGYLMRKVQSQVSVAFLDDGSTSSYQQLSFSQSQSSSPFVISDERGYLHLSWLEKGEVPGWAIYFASSAPGFVKSFGGLSLDDIGRVAVEVLFGLVIGAALIPVAIAWILPSSVGLFLSLRITDWLDLHADWVKYASLSLAIILLWVVKFGILPGITSYVPFSAWIPFLPASLAAILRIAVPIFILSLGLIGAWRFTRSSEEKPIVQFFFAYCVIDGVLSMAVYGVLILSAI